MPKYAIYSTLDKNLLKMLLMKATELTDEEIQGLRDKYFLL